MARLVLHIALLLVLAAPANAMERSILAQAGSAGGTIGKQGKSISGEEERRPQKQAKPKSQSRAADAPRPAGFRCADVVGQWTWSALGGTTTVSFRSGGTANATNGYHGTWTCSDGAYAVTWQNGTTDRFRLSSQGRTLSGNSSVMGAGISGSRQ